MKSEGTFPSVGDDEGTKPLRPRGTGLPADWFTTFGPSDVGHHYCLTLVRGISPREALRRLGVCTSRIIPTTYLGLFMMPDRDRAIPRRVFAVQIDDWVMVIELDGMAGADRVRRMSRETEAIVSARNDDGEEFLSWAVDGIPLAQYAWDLSNATLRRCGPADEGTRPDAVVPFLRRIGLRFYQPTDGDDEFLPPPVEIACRIANIHPRLGHFTGEHLGAVYPW